MGIQHKDFMGKFNYHQIILFFIFSGFVFLIYSNIFNAPFIFDDTSNIVENRHIRMSQITLDQINEILRSRSPRPVANFSIALNYYFGKYNVTGYHIVNILIHLITGILFFFFIKKTYDLLNHNHRATYSFKQNSFIVAFLSALIWLVHPLNTQSVTYTVQRMNSMAAMFYLFSFVCYIKGRIAQRAYSATDNNQGLFRMRIWLCFAGCIVSGAFAIGSKQNAATLPAFILLYEWFFFQDLRWEWSKKRIFRVGFAVLMLCIVAVMLLKTGSASLSLYSVQPFTLYQRLLTESRVVVFYISLIFFPSPYRLNLAHDYPISCSLITPWPTLLALAVIIGLIGFAVFTIKKDRLVSFCIFWFLGNLAIESSFIGLALIFEHRTYLPSMLVCFLFVALLFRHVKHRRIVAGSLCLIVLIFSVWTWQRNNVWGDDIAMWNDCIKKSPENEWPYLSLGMVVASQDEKAAISYVQKALQIKPDFPEALFAMGVWHANHQRTADANNFFEKALTLKPDFIKAHYQLALSMVYSGNLKGAGEHLATALLLDPENSDMHRDLGNILSQLGKFNEAVKHYMIALKIDPDNAFIHNNLANTYVRMGDFTKAVHHYSMALEIDPGYVNAQKNLRTILNLQKNTSVK